MNTSSVNEWLFPFLLLITEPPYRCTMAMKYTTLPIPFFLFLTITFKFSFLKAENCTAITESVHIKGPFIVAFILKGLVKQAHKKVVKELKKIVEH